MGEASTTVSMEAIHDLLRFHYDRRERLYRFLEGLTPEELTRDVKVGWRSIRGLLLHSLEAEVFWVVHALQKGERPDWDYREYGEIQAIRSLADRVRQETETFLDSLSEEEWNRETGITYSDGTQLRFTIAKALLHLILHDTHHRGQVSAVARQLGYEPPEIDYM